MDEARRAAEWCLADDARITQLVFAPLLEAITCLDEYDRDPPNNFHFLLQSLQQAQLFLLITNVFNPAILHQLVPSSIIFGMQSAGKSSLLSGLLGVPISFVHREIATRCAARYSILNTVEKTSKQSGKLGLVKNVEFHSTDGKTAFTNLTPQETMEKVADEMKYIQKHVEYELTRERIRGLSKKTMDVRIRTNHPVAATTLYDTPGIAGANVANQSGADAKDVFGMGRATLDLCSSLVKRMVLDVPDGASVPVVVMEMNIQDITSQSWKPALCQNGIKPDKLVVIRSKIDALALTGSTVAEWALDHPPTLAKWFEAVVSPFLDLTSKKDGVEMFFVANANVSLEPTPANMEKMIAAIQDEAKEGPTSKTAKFKDEFRAMCKREFKDYEQNKHLCDWILERTGIRRARNYLYKLMQNGAQQQVNFLRTFLQNLMTGLIHKTSHIQTRLSNPQETPSLKKTIRCCFATANILMQHALTGVPLNPTEHALFPIPTQMEWSRLYMAPTYRRNLAGMLPHMPPFPPNLDKAVEKLIVDELDRGPSRTVFGLQRLDGLTRAFSTRCALAVPSTVDAVQLQINAVAQGTGNFGPNEFLDSKIREFGAEILAKHGAEHLATGYRLILNDCVTLVLDMLRRMPEYTFLFTSSKFENDMLAFMQHYYVEPVVEDARSAVQKAALDTTAMPIDRLSNILVCLFAQIPMGSQFSKDYFSKYQQHSEDVTSNLEYKDPHVESTEFFTRIMAPLYAKVKQETPTNSVSALTNVLSESIHYGAINPREQMEGLTTVQAQRVLVRLLIPTLVLTHGHLHLQNFTTTNYVKSEEVRHFNVTLILYARTITTVLVALFSTSLLRCVGRLTTSHMAASSMQMHRKFLEFAWERHDQQHRFASPLPSPGKYAPQAPPPSSSLNAFLMSLATSTSITPAEAIAKITDFDHKRAQARTMVELCKQRYHLPDPRELLEASLKLYSEFQYSCHQSLASLERLEIHLQSGAVQSALDRLLT